MTVSDRVMLRGPARRPDGRAHGASPRGGSPSATSTSSRSATSTRACSATPAPTSDEIIVGLIGQAGRGTRDPAVRPGRLRGEAPQDDALAERDHRLGQGTTSPPRSPPTKAALAKAIKGSAEVEDADRALRAVVPGDEELRERLRPFIGIDPARPARPAHGRPARRPGRGRDAVPRDGRRALHAEVPRRGSRPARPRTARVLPGPAPDRSTAGCRWTPTGSSNSRSPTSPAAPARSSSPRPATSRPASSRRGQREEATAGMTPAELELHAIRTVIANCLYGADINEMAVEMCKLSLWLVSLDPKLPFSFVDDKIFHGNSLLGLTDARQLKRAAHRPGRREQAADPVRDRRGRHPPPGRPAPAAPRQRGQQRRPAAFSQHQAPPVAATSRR